MRVDLKICALAICIFFPFFQLKAQNTKLDLFFRLSDYYLKKYVNDGLVDYKYASTYSKEIQALYKMIGEIDLSAATENERKAYSINTYNLLVIYQVTKAYPLDGPMDQEGFFDQMPHKVAGLSVTLDQLEKEIIFGNFKDPRFHFVLSCAAVSCPKLADFAFKPGNVEVLLEERTKATLNDDNFIKVNEGSSSVQISKIFEWYRQDFEREGQSIIEFINRYRTSKIPADYAIEFIEYDWKLNDRKS